MTYTTKDSGGGKKTFKGGFKRDVEEGKPDFNLITPLDQPYEDQMLTRWAGLMTRGAKKYNRRNWELAEGDEALERFKSSLLRHVMKLVCDENDGEDHAAACMFNIAGLEYVRWRMKV